MYAKRKGEAFESLVASILQVKLEQITGVKPVDKQLEVNRSRASGASKIDKGDIDFGIYYQVAPVLTNIIVECKKWKSFVKLEYSKVNPKQIQSTIKAIYRLYSNYQHRHANKKVILVFAGNRTPIYVAIDKSDIQCLDNIIQFNYIEYKSVIIAKFIHLVDYWLPCIIQQTALETE